MYEDTNSYVPNLYLLIGYLIKDYYIGLNNYSCFNFNIDNYVKYIRDLQEYIRQGLQIDHIRNLFV